MSLRHRIAAFAQDGSRLAWDAGGLVAHDLGRHRREQIQGATDLGVLALGGERVLFMAYVHGSNCGHYVRMMTATVRKPRPQKVKSSDMDFETCYADGPPRILISGDGGTLVYRHYADYLEYGDVDVLRRVVGRRATAVRNSRFPTALAAAGRRIAFARRIRHWSAWDVSPTWSPDAGSVAFSRALDSENGESVETAAYVVSTDGRGAMKPLEELPEHASELDWSPDGRRFAFVVDDEIYPAAADGSGLTRIGAGEEPTWSPDGSRLAFQVSVADRPSAVYVTTLSGGEAARVTEGYSPTWSPDGNRLAVARNDGRLYVIGVAGGQAQRLSGAQDALGELDWSPDGTRIAYTAGFGGGCGNFIRIANADGTGSRRLLPEECRLDDDWPAWSPDGSMIAFSRARYSNDTDRAIYLANANGSGVRKLTSKPDDTTSVTVRPAGPGSSLSTFELKGQVPNVALSPSILAVLVRTTAGARIELRRPLERSAARSLAVPASTAPVLSASGHRVVYRVGRTIWLLDTSSMKTSAIATAASTPIGLSIEGRRIAWAENGGGRGRIRAVTLPQA